MSNDLKSVLLWCLLNYIVVDAWTICFSPDSRFLASGSHTGKINLFGVDSAKKESQLDTRGKFTLSIAYVSYNDLNTLSVNSVCIFYLIKTKNYLAYYQCLLMFRPLQSPDGKYIACGAIDGIINIFDMTTGKLLHTLEGKTKILTVFGRLHLSWKFWSDISFFHLRSRYANSRSVFLARFSAACNCFRRQSHKNIRRVCISLLMYIVE